MSGSVNKVILLGNLGRDPEIRSMQSGKKMASFSIATSKRWKDKNTQEQKEKTSWHNIVVFGDGLVDTHYCLNRHLLSFKMLQSHLRILLLQPLVWRLLLWFL